MQIGGNAYERFKGKGANGDRKSFDDVCLFCERRGGRGELDRKSYRLHLVQLQVVLARPRETPKRMTLKEHGQAVLPSHDQFLARSHPRD